MTETIQNRKRIVWIDVARGIGMLLVVIGHSNPPEWLKNYIFSFHMPLFFLLAGMVYQSVSDGHKMDGSKKDGHGEHRSRNRVVRDFKQLIIPYMVVVAMAAVFLLIIRSEGGQGYYDSLKDLLRSALYASGSGHKGIKLIGEIWFLVAMFWGRRIMDAVFRFQEPLLRTLLVGGCIGISLALACSKTWLPLDIDIAFLAAGFMYAGWAVQSFRDPYAAASVIIEEAGGVISQADGSHITLNAPCSIVAGTMKAAEEIRVIIGA